MQLGWIAGSRKLEKIRIQKAREDKIPRSQLVAGAWSAQVHGVRLGFEVFLLFVYYNFIL